MTQQQSSMMGDHSNEETEYPTNSVVDDRDDILVPSTLPPLPTEEEQDIWRGDQLICLVVVFFLGGAFVYSGREETEYPTNSVVDDRGGILVPTFTPLPTEEEQDSWRGYLLIFVLIFSLGGAYFALKNYERRWLFECTWYGGVLSSSSTSSHTNQDENPRLFLQDLEHISHSISTLSSDENSSHLFGKREKARRKEQLERELKVKVRSTLLLVVGSFLLFAFFDSYFLPGMVEMGLVRS
jgi:hypothetical protein